MSTPPVTSLTEELIAELEAAAKAATPQDFDSAERKDEGGFCECPTCGGEGSVEIESDYLNYDATAIGVQFYGVGPEHGAAERYYRRSNPATILALLAERAELKRDAERWHLRAETLRQLYNSTLTDAELDIAISAAMQEAKPCP